MIIVYCLCPLLELELQEISDCLRGVLPETDSNTRIQVKAGYEEVIQEILEGSEQVIQGREGSPWWIHFPVGYTVGN